MICLCPNGITNGDRHVRWADFRTCQRIISSNDIILIAWNWWHWHRHFKHELNQNKSASWHSQSNFPHYVKGTFANRQTFNHRGLRRLKVPWPAPNGKRIGYQELIKLQIISRTMAETKTMTTIVIMEVTEVKVERSFHNANDKRHIDKCLCGKIKKPNVICYVCSVCSVPGHYEALLCTNSRFWLHYLELLYPNKQM